VKFSCPSLVHRMMLAILLLSSPELLGKPGICTVYSGKRILSLRMALMCDAMDIRHILNFVFIITMQ